MGIGLYDVSQLYNSIAESSNARYQKDCEIEDAISYVLFEALAIEAHINYIGEEKYSDKEYFRNKIEKIHPILKKLDTISRHIVEQDFPDGLLKGWIEALFFMRNELAHAKPHYNEFDLDTLGKLSPKEALNVMQGEFGFIHKESGTFVPIHDVVKNTQGIYLEFKIKFFEVIYNVKTGLIRNN